jgi:hypothetical protein
LAAEPRGVVGARAGVAVRPLTLTLVTLVMLA